ncbi:conjugation protein [Schizosaccharomyces cryophilus OY26]|uniref:Plasma membrane fusion protein PRM1 n=1 Tax=Schizosaccharomyces cryophilus (strain OY26 / ATCC MYA-4695 / CBS 11777 / NBRC 106824 / NRRL Y48691) TaxID=653667 RepID=S9W391_SCHCR|nr:conjugation protein [Schizosaccharomyces cryophilus OY26]EPY53024.1 conjugation protein [Schizosaccharomyces cryophilus OY26]
MKNSYLGLKARLSQAWITPWTICCLYILLQFLLFNRNLQSKIDDISKSEAAAKSYSCNIMQEKVNSILNSPGMIASVVVKLTEKSINSTVGLLLSGLIDTIEAAEKTIVFFIEFTYGTYLCLLQLALNGALDAMVDVGEEIEHVVNSTLKAVSEGIEDTVSGFNSELYKAESSFRKIASWLGEDVNLPNVSIPQIQSLKNLRLPSYYDTKLESLRNSINFDHAINVTENAISGPLKLARYSILKDIGNFTFDNSSISQPKQTQFTVCSDNNADDSSSSVYTVLTTLKYTIFISLLISIIGLILINFFYEGWKWYRLKRRASLIDEYIEKNMFEDTRDLVTYLESPLLWNVKQSISFLPIPAHLKFRLRWFISYIFYPPATILLFVGIASLCSCLCQLLALRKLNNLETSHSTFSNISYQDMQYTLQNISYDWSNNTNQAILANQRRINDGMFGSISHTTLSLNHTLSVFMNEVNSTVSSIFEDTILNKAVQNVLNCLLYHKIENFEKVLTWVHNKSHINLPLLPGDVLSEPISNQTLKNALMSNSTLSQTTSSGLTKVLNTLEKSVISETKQSLLFILLWLAVCALGLLALLADAAKLMVLKTFTFTFSNLFKKKAIITSPFDSLDFPVMENRTPPPVPLRSSDVYDFQNTTYDTKQFNDNNFKPPLSPADLALEVPISPAFNSDIYFNNSCIEYDEKHR